MIERIRSSFWAKVLASFLALFMMVDLVGASRAMALTGGPSQPEVQGFTPIGTSEMVDLFTGDFSYNIPLMDVGGYPLNIGYNSGVSMDQEASWVGLGWSLNPGVLTRNMRGIPDDFNGDEVKTTTSMEPNRTYKLGVKFGNELFGLDFLRASIGRAISWNNYIGVGYEQLYNLSISSGSEAKVPMSFGLGVTSSAADGLTASANASIAARITSKDKTDIDLGISIGTSFNSRAGLGALTVNKSITASQHKRVPSSDGGMRKATTGSLGGSTGSSISYTAQSHVPRIQNNMKNLSVTLSVKTGFDLWGADATSNYFGTFSTQRLAPGEKQRSNDAYGYLYMHARNSKHAMMDFNREQDQAFNENLPNLPLTNLTHDVYSVAGQGVGGSFRPHRNEIIPVHDPKGRTDNDSYSVGAEFGLGATGKFGGDVNFTDVSAVTQRWDDSKNELYPVLRDQSSGADLDYESVYFKQVGELVIDDDAEYNAQLGGLDPIQPTVIKVDRNNVKVGDGFSISKFHGSNQSHFGLTASTSNQSSENDGLSRDALAQARHKDPSQRAKRNLLFSFLTNREADGAVEPQKSKHQDAAEHHMAEVTVTRPDGARYIYGQPLYNNVQNEVSFNASGLVRSCSDVSTDGLLSYNSGTPQVSGDNSPANKRGVDHYYNNVEMPDYAHSYLLTAVLSSDYSDIDEIEGPSLGDLGSYTVFEYESGIEDFHWRTPVGFEKASWNEGLKTSTNDDRGSYIYGRKEVKYLTAIRTKNFIAKFTLEDRNDGLGVKNENGALDPTKRVKRIQKISLFSRPDYDANGDDATPIKEVHFEYDYSLCPGVPNNNSGGGKLTLRKLYFTYGNSFKGRLSPYEFHYRGDDQVLDPNGNPGYNIKHYDRWGNYKPPFGENVCQQGEYPYTDQTAADGTADPIDPQRLVDDYAAAWTLNKISLPSGGEIWVDYESDDYAFVQDKRAMQMFRPITTSPEAQLLTAANIEEDWNEDDLPITPSNSAARLVDDYDEGSGSHNVLYFQLQEPISANTVSAANQEFQRQYTEGIDNLYFRAYTAMTTSLLDAEFVSGYAGIKASGVVANGGGTEYKYGYVTLNLVDGGKGVANTIHPITRAAWQFGRAHTPVLVFDQPNIEEDNGVEQVLKAMVGSKVVNNMFELAAGPNNTLNLKNYGKKADFRRSFIRLNNPDGFKHGGGVRVKSIRITDAWKKYDPQTGRGMLSDASSIANEFDYGQEYSYRTEDGLMSSGVAQYEPQLGGDENPFRQPIAYGDNVPEKILVPDDDKFVQGPIGESFFPAAVVGYSRVEVQNLTRPGISRNATGKVVHTFYTAKDFPIEVYETPLKAQKIGAQGLLKVLKFKVNDGIVASQGYSIVLNDMHGKPSGQEVYQEGGSDPISSVRYDYNLTQDGKLDNKVNVIKADGSLTQAELGVEVDYAADFRSASTSITSRGVNGNLATLFMLFGTFPVPSIFPSYSSEKTNFRSAVITKVTRKHGIQTVTTATDLGSEVSTKNLAWDGESGQVLVTETINDYNDPVYSMTVPSHWAYDGMGPAYKNIGITYERQTIVDGVLSAAPSGYFVAGDEVLAGDQKAWVTKVTPNSGTTDDVELRNRYGVLVQAYDVDIKVVRSGRRNLQSTPIGTITTLTNPLEGYQSNVYKNVLNASSVRFEDQWRSYCECLSDGQADNPYIAGMAGNWRAKESLLYLTDRTVTREAGGNSNIRKDGVMTTFSPYWTLNDGEWGADVSNSRWTSTSEVTKFDPFGFEVENKDALGRYSSAVYGYSNTLPVAVASNSPRSTIGFNGFEDQRFDKCNETSLNFANDDGDIITTEAEAHSGRTSVEFSKSSPVRITKTLDPCPED